MTEPIEPGHDYADHKIIGTKEEQATRIMGRHLCGWISGHTAPIDHFNQDAAMIVDEIRAAGIQFI